MNTKKITKLDKISKLVMILSVFAFTVSVFSQMFICNQISVKNTELKNISVSRKDLEKEISTLSYENATLSSLKYVDNKAHELGFVKLTNKILALSQVSNKPTAISQR